ncbi:hypothetical protein MLD38_002988 [Melastoma candidum]|uniref:Uncharacterized protein n=1 Tax=Melastoma candidum TaxID=119954 RepID=A0ACB9S5L1_9MYRT|nr:hypothetical protein MLD38_002988 [Melastoma candidum]
MAEEEFMPLAMAAPEDESDDFYGGIYHNPSSRNLSRLSVCTSSFTTNESCDFYEENDAGEGSRGRNGGYSSLCGGDDGDAVGSQLSLLSIENFDADAELSEDEEEEEVEEEGGGRRGLG